MRTIQLRFRRAFYLRHGFIFGLIFFFCLVIHLQMRTDYWLAKIFPVLSLGPVLFIVWRERKFAARTVDEAGVTRHDGRRFLWPSLEKINEVKMMIAGQHTGPVNHIDLIFKDGRARILPHVLENGYEAIQFIQKRGLQPTPVPTRCGVCGDLGDYHRAMQKGGQESVDTHLPAASGRLNTVKEVPPHHNGSSFVQQCPQCGAWFFLKTTYEYLVYGSEDEQELHRISAEKAAEMMTE